MKKRIFRIDDDNMAGAWWYGFTLHRHRKGRFSLSLQQSTRGEERLDIAPAENLKTGADVYEALADMLSEAGYDMDDVDLVAVADEIETLSEPLAEQFRRAPKTVAKREQRREAARRKREEAAFAPFAERVEAFVAQFSDEKVRGGGGMWPSRRERMRGFLRSYIGEHGAWPQGQHEGYDFNAPGDPNDL